jgi:hypothetical protein
VNVALPEYESLKETAHLMRCPRTLLACGPRSIGLSTARSTTTS